MQASDLIGFENELVIAFSDALGSTVDLTVAVEDGSIKWTSSDSSISTVQSSVLQESLTANLDLAIALGFACNFCKCVLKMCFCERPIPFSFQECQKKNLRLIYLK